jgi:ferredoxin
MTMHVSLDSSKCQGHARCALLAPDVFALDENGMGTPIQSEVPPEFESQAKEAEFSCPEGAITTSAG